MQLLWTLPNLSREQYWTLTIAGRSTTLSKDGESTNFCSRSCHDETGNRNQDCFTRERLAMEMQPGKAPQDRPKRGFWGVIRWILLWGTIFGLSGVALVAVTNKAVIWSSSDAFCGTFCHSMTWASAGYHQGPHFINASGVRASCGQCHIPYDSGHATATEYVKLLLFKADRGAKDFWNESRKTIATKEEWEKRRPQLRAEFESYLQAHNYITCRGCHVARSVWRTAESDESADSPRRHQSQ